MRKTCIFSDLEEEEGPVLDLIDDIVDEVLVIFKYHLDHFANIDINSKYFPTLIHYSISDHMCAAYS